MLALGTSLCGNVDRLSSQVTQHQEARIHVGRCKQVTILPRDDHLRLRFLLQTKSETCTDKARFSSVLVPAFTRHSDRRRPPPSRAVLSCGFEVEETSA